MPVDDAESVPNNGGGSDSKGRNPYSPGRHQHDAGMGRPSSDPSVHEEPWLRAKTEDYFSAQKHGAEPQLSEMHADPENSVWDEPGLSPELAGVVPIDAVTWIAWFRQRAAETSALESWLVTLVIAMTSGVFAILGAFIVPTGTEFPAVMAIVGAPISEELLKISLVIYVCEKRPWLFQSSVQILSCGLLSGIIFAIVENLIYLNIYVPGASDGMARWRWSVCVLLHATCSTIAAFGAVRIWQTFQQQGRMPRLADGARWIVAAVVIHGLYNFGVVMTQ